MQGKGAEGESDSQGREDLFPSILAFIHEAQPYVFILEDVKCLLDWKYRARFKSTIQRLKGHGRYYVYWRIFSPQQVGGFHHWFLASTRAAHHFKWPKLGSCQVVGLQSFFAKIKKDQEAVAPNPRIGTLFVARRAPAQAEAAVISGFLFLTVCAIRWWSWN